MLEACLAIKKFNVVFCNKKAYDRGKILRRREEMTTLKLNAGPCGFNTVIKAETEKPYKVKVTVESECPHYKTVNEDLKEPLDALGICCKEKYDRNTVYKIFAKHMKHPACPVAVGVVKAMEAEAGLALKTDIEMKFE